MSGPLPELMTPETTLKILDSMYTACRKVAFIKIEGLKSKGIQINSRDPMVIKATEEM